MARAVSRRAAEGHLRRWVEEQVVLPGDDDGETPEAAGAQPRRKRRRAAGGDWPPPSWPRLRPRTAHRPRYSSRSATSTCGRCSSPTTAAPPSTGGRRTVLHSLTLTRSTTATSSSCRRARRAGRRMSRTIRSDAASTVHPIQRRPHGIVNLFYVAIVLAVGSCWRAMPVASPFLTGKDMTIVTNPGTEDMQVVVKNGDTIERLDLQQGQQVSGSAETEFGSFYRLADGTTVYVPATSTCCCWGSTPVPGVTTVGVSPRRERHTTGHCRARPDGPGHVGSQRAPRARRAPWARTRRRRASRPRSWSILSRWAGEFRSGCQCCRMASSGLVPRRCQCRRQGVQQPLQLGLVLVADSHAAAAPPGARIRRAPQRPTAHRSGRPALRELCWCGGEAPWAGRALRTSASGSRVRSGCVGHQVLRRDGDRGPPAPGGPCPSERTALDHHLHVVGQFEQAQHVGYC